MKTRIGVLFGGRSTEHEISVISASQAMAAIDRDSYDVTPIYITKEGCWYCGEALLDLKAYRDTASLIKKCEEVYMQPNHGDFNLYRCHKPMFGSNVFATLDVMIPVLHGANGEDGTIEGLLDLIGIPYAGCDVLASANGMDKITMKMILRESGVPVVDYVWFTDKEWSRKRDELIERIESKIGYPVIVKPANLGSSVGIGKAADRQSLIEKVDTACRFSQRIIVEHMLEKMKEINCSVLGDCDDYQPSVCEEPISKGDFLSYDEKYRGGNEGMAASEKRIPADLPKETSERVQHLACETFRVLSCHGVSRVDVMIDESDGQIYVNEINTIPGSLSYYLWEATGIKFADLMDKLVQLALKRKREVERKTFSYDRNIFALGGGGKGGVKGAKGAKF